MTKATSEAASKLAKLRWSKVAKADRSKQMPMPGLGGAPRKYPKCKRYRAHVFSPKTGKCYGCKFVKPTTK